MQPKAQEFCPSWRGDGTTQQPSTPKALERWGSAAPVPRGVPCHHPPQQRAADHAGAKKGRGFTSDLPPRPRTTSSTMDFINQEGISKANPHVQRASGLVALCSRSRQLCSPAAGSLEPWLINPDSNQLPGAAQADAVPALSGFSPVFPNASFCCPRRGQFLLKTQRNPADFSGMDGKGLQGDTAARDQLSNRQPSRVISKGIALPAPVGMQSHTTGSPRCEAHPT